MKRVAITGPARAETIEVDAPTSRDGWAVVKVHAAPMCTEYKRFVAGEAVEVLGHEAAGQVVEVSGASRVRVGDRVVAMPLAGCGRCALCTSGFYIHCENRAAINADPVVRAGSTTYAQYILKQDWLLMPIPDDMPYDLASLACCGLGPSFGAMERLGIDGSTTLLITGAGPVGLGAVINGSARGARIIVLESVQYRAELARTLGAEIVLDPSALDAADRIRDLTGGLGVDSAIECSGTVGGERMCIDATRRRGSVCFVGENHDDLAIRATPDLITKGLSLMGSWHYNLRAYTSVLGVIHAAPDKSASLITHRFPMSNVQAAFEQSASRESAKILVDPWA